MFSKKKFPFFFGITQKRLKILNEIGPTQGILKQKKIKKKRLFGHRKLNLHSVPSNMSKSIFIFILFFAKKFFSRLNFPHIGCSKAPRK